MTAALLDRLVFFLRLTWKHGNPLQAWKLVLRLVRITASSEWFIPSLLILWMMSSIFLIAIFLSRAFRRRSGALRTMDLAAIFSPALVFGAFIDLFTGIVLAISQYGFVGLVAVMVWGQMVVLQLLVWHFCRKLPALSRTETVAMVIVCGIVQYGCGMLVTFVLRQLYIAVLL